jgi:N-acetylmuramic acid 6-phosphate etherase
MPSTIQLEGLQTEERNPVSGNIDQVSTLELCQIINNEDATVALAVQKCLPIIAQAIDGLAGRVRKGGRVVYVGAGTSGRLGVLDASEIPPTFSASSKQFVSLIAGGDVALRYAQEGAEDDVVGAVEDLKALNLDPALDSLIGIAASGRTPYVLRCLSYAKTLGCTTVGISCSDPSAMSTSGNVDHMIRVVTGPEVVTGSTRMKAGTATKLVLNMLSTGLMIKTGKTYGNMMIDLKSSNKKLQQRSRNIIRTICGPSCPTSDGELDGVITACNGSVKLAVATILLQATADDAARRLEINHGVLSDVLKHSKIDQISSTKVECNSDGPFVLCVDGGGSKCAAILLGKDGEEGRGEAGGCNV